MREGNDIFELFNEVQNASINYLANVCKNNLSDNLLNQILPKKYVNAYNKAEAVKKKLPRSIKSPIAVTDLFPWDKNLATA